MSKGEAMRAEVWFQSGWEPTRQLAERVGWELTSRPRPFSARSLAEKAEPGWVVLGLSPWGLWDPVFHRSLAAGALRGRTVAFFASVWSPWGADLRRALWAASAAHGGAHIYGYTLQIPYEPWRPWGDADGRRVEVWARRLAAAAAVSLHEP